MLKKPRAIFQGFTIFVTSPEVRNEDGKVYSVHLNHIGPPAGGEAFIVCHHAFWES